MHRRAAACGISACTVLLLLLFKRGHSMVMAV
jgi:hypothetical protein